MLRRVCNFVSNDYYCVTFILGLRIQDLDGENSTGIMIAQFTQKNGVRRSAARSFLRPARDRTNLHILVNTTLTKILIENKVVKG